jgi:UDP-N-acetylglucosamine 2-epimerase (non-hydrolysing)
MPFFQTRDRTAPGEELKRIRREVADRKVVLVTTHRRENQGSTMRGLLRALRRFVEFRDDVCVVFPVHPSPAVKEAAEAELASTSRVLLIKPMLVLRANTERPEAVDSGIARLVGDAHLNLTQILTEASDDETWFAHCRGGNPVFGDGTAAQQITELLLHGRRLAAAA